MELAAHTRALLGLLQDGLPLVSRPYAELAQALGLSEETVLTTIEALQAQQLIKRFAVVVHHHELGYRANAMVVWDVPDDQVDALGAALSRCEHVTLCYRRRRQRPQWPYNLYCMIHGKDRETVQARIRLLIEQQGLSDTPHWVLFSRRRYKQRGARYIDTAETCSHYANG